MKAVGGDRARIELKEGTATAMLSGPVDRVPGVPHATLERGDSGLLSPMSCCPYMPKKVEWVAACAGGDQRGPSQKRII